MCFLGKLFGRRTKQAAPPAERPPRPDGWNFTYADFMAEMKAGKRNSVGQPELDWARDYERSLIPAEMRFPQKGDVYEVLQDMEVEFMTAWAAPFTGGGKAMLLQGEKPIGAYVEAIDYKMLEERMVSASERTSPKYGGFYFYFSTVELNTKFMFIRSG